MGISVIIPYRSGTKNITELIYALRSLENNLKGLGEVFVCGEKITALKVLNYISVKDDKGSQFKERNIYRKILAACNDERVSENFLFVNDDHFLLKEYDINSLPNYFKGELYESMKLTNPGYRKSLNHTRRYLISNGKPTLDYDVHFPIIYNKKQFMDTFQGIDWNIDYGFVIKSFICNSIGVAGELMTDCKIREKLTYNQIKERLANRDWFSTADHAINDDMIKFLEETYPKKSKYEE